MRPENNPASALKVRAISAVAIDLTDGVQAVFLPHGDEWNGLRAYRCIAPAAFVNARIVTAPPPGHGDPEPMGFRPIFDSIFGVIEERQIVMASPDLVSVLMPQVSFFSQTKS